jgi:hypothetical protein
MVGQAVHTQGEISVGKGRYRLIIVLEDQEGLFGMALDLPPKYRCDCFVAGHIHFRNPPEQTSCRAGLPPSTSKAIAEMNDDALELGDRVAAAKILRRSPGSAGVAVEV